ncbi:hypothetical protein ACCS65_35725, partial [Rhizobium ruizarguesonis]
DHRLALVDAVIVAGDRAGADIAAGADDGIANSFSWCFSGQQNLARDREIDRQDHPLFGEDGQGRNRP